RSDLRRGVEEEPAQPVGAHGHRLLSPRRGLDGARPDADAVRASAVPLREATAGRGTEDADQHPSNPPRNTTALPAASARLEGLRKCSLENGQPLDAVVFPVEVVLV